MRRVVKEASPQGEVVNGSRAVTNPAAPISLATEPKIPVPSAQFVEAYGTAGVADTVSFTWGRELYSFRQFTTCEVGPYTAETTVRVGETRIQAYERIARDVTAFAEASRDAKLAAYKRCLEGSS